MSKAVTQTFRAKLEPIGKGGGAWMCIFVPFDVPEAFGSSARLSVEGEINGTPYRTSIFPMGDRFMMMINKALQKAADLKEGDMVEITMRPVPATPKPKVPDEMEKAFTKNRKAQAAFEKLSPTHRKEHVKYVGEAKRPETRVRRTKRVLKILLGLRALLLLAPIQPRGAEPTVTDADLPRVPPTEPTRAVDTFTIRPGVQVELVAAEPLVVDPIAMCFDEDSRLFVIEMRDYSERRDERLGRIRLLEDTDGDAKFDKSTVFADGLPWPTALCWFNGGLFVGSTPDIFYFKDTDGDGKADEKKLVFTGFGDGVARLNVQQLFNSLTWTLDCRIHGASGGNGGVISSPEHPERGAVDIRNADFSFDPRKLDFRRESGGGQYGLTFDHSGRKFVCSNSAHIREVMYEQSAVLSDMQYALPSPGLDIAVDGPAAEVYRTSPDEPWRVIRTKWRVAGLVAGPVEGGGRPSGYFTGASGISIYRGTALGPDFVGDAFVADIGSNLVHRKKLVPNGVAFLARRASDEQKSEFLASKDNWFRPVTFTTGPDGALYIADMYREVVEHPWSLPANIKKYLDLNSGNDRGRIYRAVATGFKQPQLPRLSKANNAELVPLLEHPNGWHRDTALRLLYERSDLSVLPSLRDLLRSSKSSDGRVYALYALSALNSLEDADLIAASRSDDGELRRHAVRLARERNTVSPALWTELKRLASDPSPAVRYELAWALAEGNTADTRDVLRVLAREALSGTDPWMKHAVYAAISRDEALRAEFPEAFSQSKVLTSKPPVTEVKSTRGEAIANFRDALQLEGNSAKGKTTFLERCASCHRLFGQGTEVGPDLQSVRTAGKETILNNIIDPNREVNQRYVTSAVSTKDGEEVLGIISNDAPNGVTLRQANGIDQFVPRTKIANVRQTGKSLMPEALEAGMTAQDMADLIAYISGQP